MLSPDPLRLRPSDGDRTTEPKRKGQKGTSDRNDNQTNYDAETNKNKTNQTESVKANAPQRSRTKSQYS